MRVRGEAIAHQDDTRLRSPLVAAAIDVFPGCARPLIRPCGAPSPGGRRGARGAWSPSPPGRGVGVRVRCEAFAHQDSTRLRPHPCPPPRSIYPQASPVPSSAPSGHLLPAGEGERVAPGAPLPRERGWGEGAGRSRRASERHQASPAPLSAAAIDVLPGFARTLIRPCGAPSPGGRRGARGAWSPSPRERGWGEGAGRSHRASERHQASLAPLSPLRSMSSQASPLPSSAPSGHLLRAGEGERVAPGAPLPPGEGLG